MASRPRRRRGLRDWLVAAALAGVGFPGPGRAGAPADGSSFSPDVLDSLSALARESGDLNAARDHALRAAELREEAADSPDADVAIGWHEAGLAHYRVEDYEQAVEAIGRAVAIWERLPDADPADVVWAQSDLAEMCRLTGRWTEAERHLSEAIERARASGSGFLPVLLNNLGMLLWDEDRLDEAEPRLRESLELRAADPETAPLALARGHQNLGVILRSQRRWDAAERELQAALALAREHAGSDGHEVVPYLNGLAGLRSRTGHPEEALALRDESLAILGEVERPSRVLLADILEESGRDLLGAGRPEEARERFGRCEAIRRELFGDDSPGVGTARLGVAQSLARSHGIADVRVGEEADAALARLSASPAFAEQRERALALRARHLRATGHRTEAVSVLRAAVALVDTLRAQRGGLDETRLLYAEEHRHETDDLVAWLVEDGDVSGPGGALAETERLRGRLLAEQLAAARLDPGAELSDELRRRLDDEETSARVLVNETRRRLRAVPESELEDTDRALRIASLDSVLAEAVLELRDVRERRKLHSPRWRRMLRALEGADAALDPDPGEAVLIYHVGYRASFVFWAGPDSAGDSGYATLRMPDGGALTANALRDGWEGVAAQLRRPRGASRGVTGTAPLAERPGPEELLAELGRTLLPAAALAGIRGADRVSILPDGVLHAVPFEALRIPGEDGRDAWALDVLPPIRYAASFRSLAPGLPVDPPSGVLVVADPDTRTLPPLPGARREADAVVSAFPAARVTRLEGAAATEEAVRARLSGAGIFHFAGHGLADPGAEGLLASLVLAPPAAGTLPGGPGPDGYLHLFELYDLDLACDLAWLSACDTSAGPILAGEGAFALSRGFLVAGARNVVASLWPLHDESAPVLVAAFLESSAGSPAARLREAKRAVRARWPEPHHWAPFVLLGQGPGGEW